MILEKGAEKKRSCEKEKNLPEKGKDRVEKKKRTPIQGTPNPRL